MRRRNLAWLALSALLLCALVLRPPLAAIGPLLVDIAASLKLNLAQQGVLTAIPVLSFGIGAFTGPWLTRKLGIDRLMLWLIGILLIAIAIRGFAGFGLLIVATCVAGLAIAVANVLLPTVVRGRFKNHVAQVTSAYTLVLSLSASFAAATAVPIAGALKSWQAALAVWVIPGALALGIWFLQARLLHAESQTAQVVPAAHSKALRRSPITWSLFTFFGIQSLGFYAILSWLPTIAIERGYDSAAAGGLLGLSTIVGVPTGFLVASNLSRLKRLDWLGFAISCLTLFGFIALTTPGLELAAGILIGLGQAATFPLSLTLISTRAADARLTTQLSALVQGWGYLFSAVGTYVFAALRSSTGSWAASIWLIVALTAVQALSSFLAGGRKLIEDASAIENIQDEKVSSASFDLFDR